MLQHPSTHQTICCSSWRTARLRFWCGRCLMSSLGKQANQQRERMRAPGGGIGASRTARTAGTHCYRSVLLSLSFSRCCCCCRSIPQTETRLSKKRSGPASLRVLFETDRSAIVSALCLSIAPVNCGTTSIS